MFYDDSEDITTFAKRLCGKIPPHCQVYRENNQPRNYFAALNRRGQLVSLRRKYEKLFVKLNAKAKRVGIGEKRLKKIKQPFLLAFQQVLNELEIVEKCMRGTAQP